MNYRNLVVGIVIGILIGSVAGNYLDQSQGNSESLSSTNSLEKENNELKKDISNLRSTNNQLNKQISDLEEELSNLQAESEGEYRSSIDNSIDLGASASVKFSVSGSGEYQAKITILQILRGDEAFEMVVNSNPSLSGLWDNVEDLNRSVIQIGGDLGMSSVYYLSRMDQLEDAINMFNRFNPLSDNEEFLLAKIKFEYLSGPSKLSITNNDFDAISSSGFVYSIPLTLSVSPEITSEIYPGGMREGWCIFIVSVDDSEPIMNFASGSDGVGGVWLKLY